MIHRLSGMERFCSGGVTVSGTKRFFPDRVRFPDEVMKCFFPNGVRFPDEVMKRFFSTIGKQGVFLSGEMCGKNGYGEMSERLKEPVLKTGDAYPASVGSNPTLSASLCVMSAQYMYC